MWEPSPEPFTVDVRDPEKKKKFKGMKSFTAFRIVPSVREMREGGREGRRRMRERRRGRGRGRGRGRERERRRGRGRGREREGGKVRKGRRCEGV